MRVDELAAFIKEREFIRIQKEKGLPRPWTEDPILATYRFCNVRREDDAVTRWLRANYYDHVWENEWFAAVVARLLNNPDALVYVYKHIDPFNPKQFNALLHSRKDNGQKNFNAAYIVSTNGIAIDKIDYITYNVLNILWADRKKLTPKKDDTLFVYHQLLMGYDGLGSFLAAQVVADLKYSKPLKDAKDWWTFAASGPGSRRGLNRVMDRASGNSWREDRWHDALMQLREAVNPKLPEPLHAQDLQNCLCEFDKYERARLGEGRPKQLYRGEK